MPPWACGRSGAIGGRSSTRPPSSSRNATICSNRSAPSSTTTASRKSDSEVTPSPRPSPPAGARAKMSRRPVADRFDIIAVRIENEGAVIGRMILRPQARCAVVGAAGGHGGTMEGIDRGPVLGRKGHMQMAFQPFRSGDPEEGLAGGAEAHGLAFRHLLDDADAERCQRLLVESLGAAKIGDAETHVIEH